MFELNSSYSDVKKTKKENGKQVLFLATLYQKEKINYLDTRTTTLVLNVGMFKWPCWALQCDFQLNSLYLQL